MNGRVRLEQLRNLAQTPRGAVARSAAKPSRKGSTSSAADPADHQGGNINGAGTRTIRLLLVDDRAAVRTGLRIWFALQPDLEVVGEASDGSEAISLARTLHPDVVLIDVEMPGMDGISATAALRSLAPQSAVVILTLYDDAVTRTRAQEAGAAAFVAKYRIEETLLAEIRRVAMAHEKQRRQERSVKRQEGSET